MSVELLLFALPTVVGLGAVAVLVVFARSLRRKDDDEL